ncbi:DUF523 domain-containing protein [Aquihabitans sp. G128]|uniref:DUF523 domain-containing protein n=1 Tax=Aquihabitans sp. G128 TaxID=2849779 RepID=UPI001C21D660|nr:DUF523 domain-containing protein [Aquihabitans sp. G128]QXC62365.1 DUF523 domain-containing protein [Aquihabitans sp. G128]
MADGTAPEAPDRGPSGGRADRPALLVSACLLGVACNHRGAASPRAAVDALADRYELVEVCPEVAGGLPTPRDAAEQVVRAADGVRRVVTVVGDDVTEQYRRGAEVAVELATERAVVGAVLKARSPSCGSAEVYDGTFSRTLVPGEGLTATALRAAGVDVVSEEDVAAGRLPG